MSVVEIPARLVPLLRRAVMLEMGGFGGDLEEACATKDNVKDPGRFRAVFANIDASRTVIDALGWIEPEDISDPEPVALDLDWWRRQVVIRALHSHLDFKREVMARASATDEAERRCGARGDIDAIEEFLTVHGPSEETPMRCGENKPFHGRSGCVDLSAPTATFPMRPYVFR